MSRTTSANFRSAAFSNETDEVVICLLTITHAEMAEPLRLSSDPTQRISENPLAYATVSRGETFVFLPFEFTLPADQDDVPPRVSLNLANADRALIGLLRTISSPLQIKVEVVLASSPDEVEVDLPIMQLSEIDYDAQGVRANLVIDGMQTEPFPSGQFDRGRFPGLF